MDKTIRPGGLYRNASGHGYHDAHGEAIPLAELPRELLNEEELAELDGAAPEPEPELESEIPVDVPEEPQAPADEPTGVPPAEESKAPAKRRKRR